MQADVRVAVDAMGGDLGPSQVVASLRSSLQRHPRLIVSLVGDRRLLDRLMPGVPAALRGRCSVHHASEVVGMADQPALALRRKRGSSMRLALELLAGGACDACLSAGNTGALMATAKAVLGTLPGIQRPAICAPVPSLHGRTHLLDLGANVDSPPQQLLHFGLMGSELVRATEGLDRPAVALLNVGSEASKGNEQVRRAAELFERSDLHYIGFCEGDDIFLSDADVVVCDGFVGNVALKATEGLARMIRELLPGGRVRGGPMGRLLGLAARPFLQDLRRSLDPRRYNGASLLGLRGTVVKSHGGADAMALTHAMDVAVLEVEKGVPMRIRHHLQRLVATQEAR